MPQISSEYQNLKSDIITKSDDSLNLLKVKDYFKVIIKSRRKLSKIHNLNDIFNFLEERDVLNCNNVSVLKYLGNVLRNEAITNLVHGYEKLYAEQETCVCGKKLIFSLPIVIPERKNFVQDESNELQLAIHNVSLNIGRNWRVLSSELCVPECHVDTIREKYPSNFELQALKILEVWIKHDGEAATLDVLKRALESRLCKMKGLGLHMLKPLITVE